MKKKVILLALTLAFSMLLTACGSSASTPASTSDTSTDDSTEQTASVDYPKGTITLICPFGAGGSSDLTVRALATAAEKYLGTSITIENVSGASASLGTAQLSTSDPDGYTIGLVTSNSVCLVPHQLDGITYVPDDFKYICTYGQYGYGFVVSADSGIESIDDVIELAKNSKAPLPVAASGASQLLVISDFAEAAGIELEPVTYSSGAEIITDLLGGHIQVAVSGESEATPYIKSGELKLLASTTDQHWSIEPDMETMQELGYENVIQRGYASLAVPADTPDEIVTILRDAFEQATQDQDYLDVMDNLVFAAVYQDGDWTHDFYVQAYDEFAEALGG